MTPLPVVVNDCFLPVFDSSAIYKVFPGGRGSGKSHFVGKQYIPIKCATSPGFKALAMRKVATSLRLSVWPALLSGIMSLGLLPIVSINKSDKEILFNNGSLIACNGADDPEKIKSLEGFDVAWLEEATEFTEPDFLNIDAALKSEKKEILATFNPIPQTPEYSHFLKANFLDRVNPDALVIKTTYRDNIKFLPQHYIDNLERLKETNPKLWDMWANGNYVTLEGVIFDNWDVVDSVPSEGGVKFVGYGLDFGFSVDPAALVAIWQAGNDVWLEQKLYQTGLTNSDLINEMISMAIDRNAEIIADSAEPKSIEEIRRAGFNVHPANKGSDSVRNGIDQMKALRLHVVRGSSDIIKELSAYSWKRDKDGKSLPAPMDSWNHGIDAIRYRISVAKKDLVFI